MNESAQIFRIADALTDMSAKLDTVPLDRLTKAAEGIAKSWSGSWFGYHSRVYYKDLLPVPPGARFSMEWGLRNDHYFLEKTVGEWVEYEFDAVVDAIHEVAGIPECDSISALARKAAALFEESKSSLLSLLSIALQEHDTDSFLKDTTEKIKEERILAADDFVRYFQPSGPQMSRDANAIQAGLHTPPHIFVIAMASELRSPFTACDALGKLARRLASHLENRERKQRREDRVGTNVFVGHGRSHVWKDLKDFVQDRLHLPWDEFNRIPVAGVANTTRLSRMLDEAAIAFLIMTAEDEDADGKVRARLNVVHEVGLFQGRLGFEKAIVLLEEGCEEFSNISGLGHIKFPKGNIAAAFEDIRRVLEREKLIEE